MDKRTLMHCWWECKLEQPLWKTVWRFLKKLRRVLSYDPAVPLLGGTAGCLSKEYENTNLKRYMHHYVHCSIIYNSQDIERT